MNAELREHIRQARSEVVKSLRRRDLRMFQDIQKSVSQFEDQLGPGQTLVGPALSGDSTIPSSAL